MRHARQKENRKRADVTWNTLQQLLEIPLLALCILRQHLKPPSLGTCYTLWAGALRFFFVTVWRHVHKSIVVQPGNELLVISCYLKTTCQTDYTLLACWIIITHVHITSTRLSCNCYLIVIYFTSIFYLYIYLLRGGIWDVFHRLCPFC